MLLLLMFYLISLLCGIQLFREKDGVEPWEYDGGYTSTLLGLSVLMLPLPAAYLFLVVIPKVFEFLCKRRTFNWFD